MKKRILISLVMVGVFLTTGTASADYCPSKVAAIHRDPLALLGSETLKQVYQKLGCDLTIQAYSAKRSVLDFNKGKIDGEAFRFRLIENQYKRAYVRSARAVVELPGVLWISTSEEKVQSLPLGYVRGYTWHEKYTSEHDVDNIGFSSEEDLFAAWNNGSIGSLLGDRSVVSHYIQKQKLTSIPVEKEVVFNQPLYHYLSEEFAPFMADFSNEIEKTDPFNALIQTQ